MILYLIRHAEPEQTEYSGFPGPNLSDFGKHQAIEIANILKNTQIKNIYTSDYTRVLQTLKPYETINQKAKIFISTELREREKETETHESLVYRVQTWFDEILKNEFDNFAIFGHCGSINMIIWYLDSNKTILKYPYICPFECLTPKAGIWELELQNNKLIKGKLLNYKDKTEYQYSGGFAAAILLIMITIITK